MSRTYRIATRQSRLAQAQANLVGKALIKADIGSQYELVFITTTGDTFMGDLSKVGGKGAFVKEIEEALLNGEADIAVHSMKDVPHTLPEGLLIAACLPRDDIRDAVLCRNGDSLVSLKPGAKIGTSAIRRAMQLRGNFPHLEIVPLRGNVDTRIEKLDKGEVDAILLAKCGLDRLNLQNRISEVLEPDMMCPAGGQGAIGIECRENDADLRKILATINDADTFACVRAEREMLRVLGGNCHTPVAGFCQVTKNNNLRLIAMVGSPDGKKVMRTRQKMGYDQWKELGEACAQDLLDQGAEEIIHATASV